MWSKYLFVVLLILLEVTYAAVSKPQSGHKSRVAAEDLSSQPHEKEGLHNPRYDQEALFGDDAKRLDDLTPEQGLEKLGAIVDKMDEDHDGYVTPEELRTWLRKVHQRSIRADAKRAWEEQGLKLTEPLTWEAYTSHIVGEDGEYDEEDDETQKSYLTRDKRRWDKADINHDGVLSLDEAGVFHNPEAHPEMHDLIVKETIEELDKNKDGMIDLDEYIADLWQPASPNDPMPEWVVSEKQNFVNDRDTNHDGKLDDSEVKAWLFPPDYDHSEAEVKHLLAECDTDLDGRLTREEIQSRYDLLVGSAATNYGEVLTDHDEL